MSDMDALDPATAWQRLCADPNAVYLDVRSEREYDQGHPTGAWNIPILHASAFGMRPNAEFAAVARAVLPQDALVVVGCRSGQRSDMAATLLREAGFTRAVNMSGGFAGGVDAAGATVPGWAACGLPSTQDPTPGRTWQELKAAAGG